MTGKGNLRMSQQGVVWTCQFTGWRLLLVISTMTAWWMYSLLQLERTICFKNLGKGKFKEMTAEAGVAGISNGMEHLRNVV